MSDKRYPLTMTHSAYHPGYVGNEVKDKSGFTYFQGGSPARFPPVTVNGADDEEYYAAKGYIPSGNSNPAAFAAGLRGETIDTDEFPKWVYPNGDDKPGVVVDSPEEEKAIMGAPSASPQTPAPNVPEAAIEADEDEVTRLRRELAEAKEAAIAARREADEALAQAKYNAAKAAERTAIAGLQEKTAKAPATGRGAKAWETRRRRLAESEASRQPSADDYEAAAE